MIPSDRGLQAIQEKIVNVAYIVLSVSSLPAVVASLARSTEIGWQPVMYLHVIAYLFVVAIAVLRKRVPHTLKTVFLTSLFLVLGIGGLASFGPVGISAIALTTILATIFFGLRLGIAIAVTGGLSIAVVAFLVVAGDMSFVVEPSTYVRSSLAWIVTVLGFAVLCTIVVFTLGKLIGALTKTMDELATAKAAAEEANQAKSVFLASMSHEIRTPMNAILGFSEILTSSIREGQQREFLDAIRTSGKSLLGLINDILDLSKVEAGKLELEFGPCDAAAIARDMAQIFVQKAEEKGIEFLVEVTDDFPAGVVLDELRLRQSVINLIGNAIKFTDKGHVKLIASGSPSGDDAVDLRFDVTDTGIGIPDDQLGKVFGAFEQTKGQSAAKFGGTGLGLSISKRLCQMMGGDITLSSQLGVGNTFSIVLDGIAVASEADVAACSADESVPEVSFDPARILVVDDVPNNRLLIKTYLSDYEFEVVEAGDGNEALDAVRAQAPSVVLTDLRMPAMDGMKLTRHLKDDPASSHVPVIAVTASAMKEEEEQLREICDDFLTKPVSRAGLVAALMKFLPHEQAAEMATTVAETGPSWSADQLSVSERAELPQFLRFVESQRETWTEISATLTINDIELFASRMQEEAHRSGYVPLSTWAEKLATQASMFDMAKLPATLEEYPRLLSDLNVMAGGDVKEPTDRQRTQK